jgi:hypothetical protein
MNMKRSILLSIILTLCVFTCACSYAIEFAIINTSDSTIDVEYTLIPDWQALDHPTKKPLKMTLSQYNAWLKDKDWTEVPDNEFVYDATTKKCNLKLAPNEVLRLTFVHDRQVKNEDIDSFGIESVRLNGSGGEIIYRGKQFYKQFVKKNTQNYHIVYK